MAHITVNDVTPKDQYTATAGQTEFTVSWPFFEDDSLAVYQTASGANFDETADLLTLSTHYTVTGAGNVAGVTRKITLVTGATAGDIITIIRVEPIERTTDFQNNGDLLAETLNDEQDKELMIMQQLDEKLDRSFKLSLFETGISAELPAPDALKIFRWNAAANAIEYVAASTLSTTLATSNWVVDSFVDGTDFTAGTTTQLTLSQEPGVIQNTWIFFDGVPQHQTEYSLAVDVITFTSAIPVGTNKVEVRQNQALDQGFTDASAVTYSPAGAGAVDTDVQTKLREFVSPNDFGAVGDGVANDTDALNDFFSHCINNSVSGHILAGTYLVTLGQLAFDNAHVTTAWPKITTDGFEAVTFKAASNTDNPFIKISNGTAVSGVGKFWQGGSLGGITFEKASGSASGNTNNHGLVLIGIENTEFGYMAASELGGDTVHIEQKLYGGNNPDPYNVSRCVFEGVEGVSNGGWAFNNNNYVGFNGCLIKKIRAISNVSGVYNGMGAANKVGTISAGSCGGWGIGDQSDVTGGASTRFLLETAEFDDIENGIDTTIAANCDFGIVRFVHRHEFSSLNPAGGYWPRTALKIGSASRVTNMLTFNVIHRIEAGGVKGDMGEFADFVSAGGNLNDCMIRSQVLDNASFGFTNSDMFTNFAATSTVHYTNNDELIIDSSSYNHTYVRARNSGTTAIPNGGFTTASNWVAYDTAVEGETDNYDTGTYEYTAPAEGVYNLKATLALNLTAGNRVRMAFYKNGAALFGTHQYAVSSNAELYTLEGDAYLNVGDVIKVNADQDSGAGVTTGGILSANDSYFTIYKV